MMGNLMDSGIGQAFQKNMMASFVQIATLVIIISACVVIVTPFAGLAIWGVVMAVAIYPLFLKVAGMLGGRRKLTATLFIIVGLALVLIPGWSMTKSKMSTNPDQLNRPVQHFQMEPAAGVGMFGCDRFIQLNPEARSGGGNDIPFLPPDRAF